MANTKYLQVIDLLAAGTLKWTADSIKAVLLQGATFLATQTNLSQVAVPQIGVADIQGRYMLPGGAAMGLPAIFTKVAAGPSYQMILIKDDGRGDPLLLAFFDVNSAGEPLTLANNGTLLVRPLEVDAEQRPLGLWLRF